MSRRSPKTKSRLIGLLASGVVGVVLALALPGLAFADTAVADPAPAQAATPAAEATPVETTPADQATPSDQATPPAGGSGQVDEGPVGADSGAGAAPAPPPTEQTPVASQPADGSTPAPQPETPVTPGSSGTSALPVSPDAPVVTSGDVRGPAVTPPSAPTTQTVTLPAGPEAQVAAAVSATQPDATTTTPPAATEPKGPAAARPRDLIFDARGQAVAPITAPARAPSPSFGEEPTPPEGFGPTIAVPAFTAPAGSSLLAVLAGYVLPGSGAPPASTIVMLVLLGLMVAALYAPRPEGSERIHLRGLIGPRSGHGLAVRRPG